MKIRIMKNGKWTTVLDTDEDGARSFKVQTETSTATMDWRLTDLGRGELGVRLTASEGNDQITTKSIAGNSVVLAPVPAQTWAVFAVGTENGERVQGLAARDEDGDLHLSFGDDDRLVPVVTDVEAAVEIAAEVRFAFPSYEVFVDRYAGRGGE